MPWYVPLLIFVARLCDVSIGIVRTILVIRGNRYLAALLGFVEVSIWITAVSSVVIYIKESWLALVAYSGGFAVGNLLGILIEERLALGQQAIRVINTDPGLPLAQRLREHGLAVTQLEGMGLRGKHEVCFLVVPRRRTREVTQLVLLLCPGAFLTVEDVRDATTAARRAGNRLSAWGKRK